MLNLDTESVINGEFSPEEKISIVELFKQLGDKKMTVTSHSYQADKEETIWEAANRVTKAFTKGAQSSAAISLMQVVLAANRNYEKAVRLYVERMREKYAGLTLKALSKMVDDAGDAPSFKEVWGHNDSKKFEVLKSILSVFTPKLGKVNTPENDFNVVAAWAHSADLQNISKDEIGSIKGIGVATFQHLRMVFGVNTVKPDLRVKQVLEKEFKLKVSDITCIAVVEKFAEITGYSPLLIDQILVKYGSGHYYRRADISGGCSYREDKETNRGIAADADTHIPSDEAFAGMKRCGHPRADTTKVQLTMPYDQDVVEAFKAGGPGWQSRMNDALREWLKEHRAA